MTPTSGHDSGRAARYLRPWGLRRAYHRASLDGADRIPPSGGAVLVSNHGRLDFDCFVLIGLILRSRGRLARLLADHLWFRFGPTRHVMHSAGAVDGTPHNALGLLRAGELLLTYPGGVREITGSRFGREHIDWRGRTGFARVALDAGVPIVPVLGVGVNNGFVFVTGGRRLGRLLYRRILRMGPAYDAYRDPLAIGVLPVPLPYSTAVHLPLPCRLRYVVGEPIYPSGKVPDGDGAQAQMELARRTEEAMRALIAAHGRPWES